MGKPIRIGKYHNLETGPYMSLCRLCMQYGNRELFLPVGWPQARVCWSTAPYFRLQSLFRGSIVFRHIMHLIQLMATF